MGACAEIGPVSFKAQGYQMEPANRSCTPWVEGLTEMLHDATFTGRLERSGYSSQLQTMRYQQADQSFSHRALNK